MTKTWCVGGRHYCNTIKQNVYEKVNPRTKKLGKIIDGMSVVFVVVINHKFLLSK